jgi:hypothetical protein
VSSRDPLRAPPIGNLRWQPPQPRAKWAGTWKWQAYSSRADDVISLIEPKPHMTFAYGSAAALERGGTARTVSSQWNRCVCSASFAKSCE